MLASDIARKRGHLSWISKDPSQKRTQQCKNSAQYTVLFSLLRKTNYWKVFINIPGPPSSTSLWMYQLRMIYTQRIFQKQYYYHITYAYCMSNGSSLSWVSVSTAKQNFNCFCPVFQVLMQRVMKRRPLRKRLGPCGYHISNGNLLFFIENTSAMKDES